MKLPLQQITLAFAIVLTSLGLTSGSTKVSAYSNTVIASTTTPVEQLSLQLRMQGQEVKKLQEELKEIGFYHGQVTGNFDSRTEVAVKRAQQTYGLPANGVVDPATRRAFWRNLSRQRRIKMQGANRGAPGQREAAGTRAGRCPTVDSALTALVPATQETLAQGKGRTSALTPAESVSALTLAEYPSFWFYVPYSPDALHSASFVLLDDKDNYVYKTTLTLSETPGIVSFRLPSTAEPLEIGKPYRWYFLIPCDPQNPSRSVFVNGWVQRVAPIPALMSQLETATPRERVALYAAAGIWHEAQTILAELRRTYPQNAAIAADWSALLQSIGLEELAQKPIVAGLHP
jgi:peptidoglycan hydrolase-like protein with peptidoglycan-binding domain